MRFCSERALIRALLFATVALMPLALRADPAADHPATHPATYLGSYVWAGPQADWFGGVSGFDLMDDGSEFLAVSDRGSLIHGRLERAGGQVSGVQLLKRQAVSSRPGNPHPQFQDGEGVALLPGGGFCISYEATHLTACYADWGATPVFHAAHPAFGRLHYNSTLEALAVDPQGRLVTVPENAPSEQDPFPLYRLESGGWQNILTLPRSQGFLPVGADFGPDGRFYVLERDVSLLGFRSRVRSWTLQADTAQDERLHLETAYLTHSNLEALSVWRDSAGRIRLTMISDDNFLALMQTEIVEYAIPTLAPKGKTN